jgi:hypothetical protein
LTERITVLSVCAVVFSAASPKPSRVAPSAAGAAGTTEGRHAPGTADPTQRVVPTRTVSVGMCAVSAVGAIVAVMTVFTIAAVASGAGNYLDRSKFEGNAAVAIDSVVHHRFA